MNGVLELVKILARLPLSVRRVILRALWRGTLPLRGQVGFDLEPAFERFLKVGTAEARRMALEHDFQDLLLIMEWYASIGRSHRQMTEDVARVRVSDAALVERIAGSSDVVILAPMHMGSFPFGITYVLWKYFAGRRLLVLRARDDLAGNNVAMDRMREIASELRIMNTRNEAEFIDGMRFIRKGGVVVSLIDLPQSYGSPAEVSLFGHDAAIAFGLDAMARMLKAVVLPMTVRSLLSRDEIVFGQPFEVASNSPEDRRALAAAMARQIEDFVKIDPAQWHMWTRILEFYPWVGRAPSPGGVPALRKAGAHADL